MALGRKKKKTIDDIASFLAGFSQDPVGFVYAAFPWGQGSLKGQKPLQWQIDVLKDIAYGIKSRGEVVHTAVASGNGIGKSALVSWIILWAMATYDDCRGIVTANTDTQLRTKTWPELAKWHSLFIGKHMFTYSATAYTAADKDHEKTWRVDAIPWSENNPEAFAGLHNQGKRTLIIFDEASSISDSIWETIEGATTDRDTQIIWSAFGNPTRNSGRFYDCFHRYRTYWEHRQIDSRCVEISNHTQLDKWVDEYGADSDFVKVHVAGKFPSVANGQLISRELATQAAKKYFPDIDKRSIEPFIIGVDPAWTGEDKLVVYGRKGNWTKVLYEQAYTDDYSYIANKLAYLYDENSASKGFIDQGYGEGIYSILKSMGRGEDWELIPFGAKATNDYYINKRAEMWDSMKKWLKEGGTIENKEEIIDDLAGPEAFINKRSKFQLESKADMKARGLCSPNYADALALTFAQPVVVSHNGAYERMKHMGKIRKYGSM
jgi:hypothetical protein